MEISLRAQLDLYRHLLRIRRFEERVAELYPEQEMRTPVHLCLGQEGVAAGVCAHLRRDDYLFSTHRSHGHCIAKGMSLRSIAAELYGRQDGCCKGRGGSMHLADPENGIPGSTAIVGGSIPLAVGAALSAKMQGNGRVSVTFFGDGAAEEGSFHESLNFASLHCLPVVFVCENNLYATNSPLCKRQPAAGIACKGAAYGIPGLRIDGNNVLEVYSAAGDAVARARSGGGPMLLECLTYRWKGHVGPQSDVEQGCRPGQELASWLERCPVRNLRDRLLAEFPDVAKDLEQVEMDIQAQVVDAFTFAKAGSFPAPETLLEYVE